jgi:hypothetical protein
MTLKLSSRNLSFGKPASVSMILIASQYPNYFSDGTDGDIDKMIFFMIENEMYQP